MWWPNLIYQISRIWWIIWNDNNVFRFLIFHLTYQFRNWLVIRSFLIFPPSTQRIYFSVKTELLTTALSSKIPLMNIFFLHYCNLLFFLLFLKWQFDYKISSILEIFFTKTTHFVPLRFLVTTFCRTFNKLKWNRLS